LGISYRDFTEYRGNNQVFSEMAGNTSQSYMTGAGEPAIVNAADVTPEIFSGSVQGLLRAACCSPKTASQARLTWLL
jgi:hypothetical protein